MFKKIRERLNLYIAKKPSGFILAAIIVINILLILISALVISAFSLKGTENMGFWEAAYYTVAMILDAGCIENVVSDIGAVGVGVTIFCIVVIILGMILFTGATIGYVTNFISNFIENANGGNRKLVISGHTIIINWNSRASEIVNDMLYCKKAQKIIVLVNDNKESIEKEINERISGTISSENENLKERLAKTVKS